MISRNTLRALAGFTLLSASVVWAAAPPPPAGIDAKKLSHHVKVISGDDYDGRGACCGKSSAYGAVRMCLCPNERILAPPEAWNRVFFIMWDWHSRKAA